MPSECASAGMPGPYGPLAPAPKPTSAGRSATGVSPRKTRNGTRSSTPATTALLGSTPSTTLSALLSLCRLTETSALLDFLPHAASTNPADPARNRRRLTLVTVGQPNV